MNKEAKKITVVEAKKRLAEEISYLVKELDGLGVVIKNRIYYFDKNLLEHDDFNSKTILIVGNIGVGTENMESDDFCDFAACVEIRTAYVNEDELNKAVAELKDEVLKFTEGAKEAESIEAYITEISKKQSEDASRASEEFAKEMKKNRIKLIIGVVAAIILIGGAILAVSLIK